MANELQPTYSAGATLYFVLRNAAFQFWNFSTPGFEAFNAAHWANYAGTITGATGLTSIFYSGNFPSGTSAGAYFVEFFAQVGGGPAVTDLHVGSQLVWWTGSADTVPPTLTAIWQQVVTSGFTAGQAGYALNTAGSETDPWATILPGSYPSGSAGNIVGGLVNRTIYSAQPVAQNGSFRIVQGADYYASDGYALVYNDTSNTWPTLTGASVAMWLWQGNTTTKIVFTMQVNVATGNGKQVQLQLSALQTAGLALGPYRFGIFATLADGHTVELVAGPGPNSGLVALS